MEKIVSNEVMRQDDKQTIEQGTSSLTLIDRAANALFSSFPWHGRIGIVCGKGNNGGDGIALSILLKENDLSYIEIKRLLRLSDEELTKVLDRLINDGVIILTKKEKYKLVELTDLRKGRIRIKNNHAIFDYNGKEIEIIPQSICVHGDNLKALEFVKKIRETLEREGILIKPLSSIV